MDVCTRSLTLTTKLRPVYPLVPVKLKTFLEGVPGISNRHWANLYDTTTASRLHATGVSASSERPVRELTGVQSSHKHERVREWMDRGQFWAWIKTKVIQTRERLARKKEYRSRRRIRIFFGASACRLVCSVVQPLPDPTDVLIRRSHSPDRNQWDRQSVAFWPFSSLESRKGNTVTNND